MSYKAGDTPQDNEVEDESMQEELLEGVLLCVVMPSSPSPSLCVQVVVGVCFVALLADAADTRRKTTPADRTGGEHCMTQFSCSLSDADCGKYMGPVRVDWWCAATAGPSPPRPSLPDLQPDSADAAAPVLGGRGPFLGTFGWPRSAQSLAKSFVDFIACVGWVRCLPFLHSCPARCR